MDTQLASICNNNPKNMPSDETYDAFNKFIFSTDIKLMGKLLHRYEFFNRVKNLPGDIVEIGVFKGSGIASFSKFLDIYCPNSNKKVVGFDIFDIETKETILDKDGEVDKSNMNIVYSKVAESELSLKNVTARLDAMQLDKKYILVRGDVEDTLPKFLEDNPGFRISLLYIDIDLSRPTYYSLRYLWDRILPGGIILFDEYEYHKFSESVGVERFLKERGLAFNLISTNWMAPTAYIVKERI